MARSNNPPDYSWEKKYAPKITRRQVIVALAVYGVWIAFLLIFALRRWFGLAL